MTQTSFLRIGFEIKDINKLFLLRRYNADYPEHENPIEKEIINGFTFTPQPKDTKHLVIGQSLARVLTNLHNRM